jgi:hypothetical protein
MSVLLPEAIEQMKHHEGCGKSRISAQPISGRSGLDGCFITIRSSSRWCVKGSTRVRSGGNTPSGLRTVVYGAWRKSMNYSGRIFSVLHSAWIDFALLLLMVKSLLLFPSHLMWGLVIFNGLLCVCAITGETMKGRQKRL